MLDCMVTCRCMDKKPYDNILKDLSITKLSPKEIVKEALRGGGNMKPEVLFNRPAGTSISIKNAGSIVDSGFDATVTPISSRLPVPEVNSTVVSAIMAVRKQGNFFAPLPGNWHRIIGLIQRNSVV